MITSNFLKKLNSKNSQTSNFHINNFLKYTPINSNIPNESNNLNQNTESDVRNNIQYSISLSNISPSGSNFLNKNEENVHINIPPNIQTNKFNDNLKNIIDSITKYGDESSIDENTDFENEFKEENMWNKEMVKEFIDISEECSEESIKYKKQSSFYINWGNSLKILNVVLGVGSMCIASSSLDESIKNPIYIVLSGLYSISSSVYGIFSFSEKGVVLKDISYQLDNLSRMIRCEILKPSHNRQSVNDFIIFIQSARDKIIKKDNTN